MIFVAVGTQKFAFDRLLKLVDELIEKETIQESVVAQVGYSDYRPNNYEYKRFMSKDEFEDNIKRCAVLITHSGVATIITGLKYEKKIIVVPRLAKFGEHVDDHQVQIAQSFLSQNLVMVCDENDDLSLLINEAKKHHFSKYKSQRKLMIKTIQDYLSTI